MKILIFGGAGFVGFHLTNFLIRNGIKVTVVDNLSSKNSLINSRQLIKYAEFYKKNIESFKTKKIFDVIINLASNPSVINKKDSNKKVIQTNFLGTLNSAELAISMGARYIFFSTSRVYDDSLLNKINYKIINDKFVPRSNQNIEGINKNGISEIFSKNPSSLYGITKLQSEDLIKYLSKNHKLSFVINRFGLITGLNQSFHGFHGIIPFWISSLKQKKKLNYIGFNGKGNQTRDILHISDLCNLIYNQINYKQNINSIFNVGGGAKNSISLLNLTNIIEDLSNEKLYIGSIFNNRNFDIPYYVTNNSKVSKFFNWKINYSKIEIIKELYDNL